MQIKTALDKLNTSSYKTYQTRIFWFSLSLTFSAIYSLLGLREAFSAEYIVQDDARQHVFWMQRFLEPNLFPKDLIADYFQSVAPAGDTALYQAIAHLGIEPLLLSKLLPGLLGLVSTAYCFGVCIQLLPVPAAGFIATLLLTQSLWLKDDLVSATPRAFIYPIFLAFLYYLLRRSLLLSCVAIALMGLFYPQGLFIAAIILILRLLHWRRKLPQLSLNRNDYLFCAVGLGVAVLVMLPFVLKTSVFGPTITAAVARNLPEFLPGGRSAFFFDNPFDYWLFNYRSGFLPIRPVVLAVGLLLPILVRFPSYFPLTQQITRNVAILPQTAIASAVMFFAAHALLFKLHLPSRYSEHSLRIVLALAAGITFTVLWDTLRQAYRQRVLVLTAVALLGIALLFYPSFDKNFPNTKYKVGNFPSLYHFFQAQPKDSLIASLSEEANNLPTFAKRSILVGREYAIPYHQGYYRQIQQRTLDLIQAQYSPNLAIVKSFIQQYGVDFWLLEQEAFTPEYLIRSRWLRKFPVAKASITQLQESITPALSSFKQPCTVFEIKNLAVLQTACILETSGALHRK